jgi:hypothetical protein
MTCYRVNLAYYFIIIIIIVIIIIVFVFASLTRVEHGRVVSPHA